MTQGNKMTTAFLMGQRECGILQTRDFKDLDGTANDTDGNQIVDVPCFIQEEVGPDDDEGQKEGQDVAYSQIAEDALLEAEVEG